MSQHTQENSIQADRESVITVRDLEKRFNREAGFFSAFGDFIYAVNGVSFTLYKNETYGLVGESGCGKTTTARLLLRMYEATAGDILYRGSGISGNVGDMNMAELKAYRDEVKYIFQDPARSLNPRMRIEDILLSGYRWSKKWPGKKQAREEAAHILEETNLSADDLMRRPADFSGGQRQRISIARALIMRPRVLVCDEVVSALDVSIQGQILNLLLDMKQTHELSMIFITHDLKVACYFCDRIGVMYRGKLVEEAPAAELYRSAQHPYTKLLFESVEPTHIGREEENSEVRPLPADHKGCVFFDRCPLADRACAEIDPAFTRAAEGHLVRCLKCPGHRPQGERND